MLKAAANIHKKALHIFHQAQKDFVVYLLESHNIKNGTSSMYLTLKSPSHDVEFEKIFSSTVAYTLLLYSVGIYCKLISNQIELTKEQIIFPVHCKLGRQNQLRNNTWRSISVMHIVITLNILRFFEFNRILSLLYYIISYTL